MKKLKSEPSEDLILSPSDLYSRFARLILRFPDSDVGKTATHSIELAPALAGFGGKK
jgi:hypothetical protein